MRLCSFGFLRNFFIPVIQVDKAEYHVKNTFFGSELAGLSYISVLRAFQILFAAFTHA